MSATAPRCRRLPRRPTRSRPTSLGPGLEGPVSGTGTQRYVPKDRCQAPAHRGTSRRTGVRHRHIAARPEGPVSGTSTQRHVPKDWCQVPVLIGTSRPAGVVTQLLWSSLGALEHAAAGAVPRDAALSVSEELGAGALEHPVRNEDAVPFVER